MDRHGRPAKVRGAIVHQTPESLDLTYPKMSEAQVTSLQEARRILMAEEV